MRYVFAILFCSLTSALTAQQSPVEVNASIQLGNTTYHLRLQGDVSIVIDPHWGGSDPDPVVPVEPIDPVEPPVVESKKMVQGKHLELVGGYRFPNYSIDRKNNFYASGGIDWNGSTWIANHSTVSQYVYELSEPGGELSDWNELVPTGRQFKPFVDVSKIDARGVQWLDENRALVSGRKSYRSGPTETWLAEIDLANQSERLIPLPQPELDEIGKFSIHQAFGAGFTRIPQAWADAHTYGRTIGMAAGGYDVLNSPLGPALAAYRDGDASPFELLNHPKETPAPRDPQYRYPVVDHKLAQLPMWKSADGDQGFWQAGDCSRGAAWIDDNTFKGVIWGAFQARGILDYRAQGDPGSGQVFAVMEPSIFYNPETGGPNRGNHQQDVANVNEPNAVYSRQLYIYDPDQIAEVAAGKRQAHECEPIISEFPFAELEAIGLVPNYLDKKATRIAGLTWDSERKLLWVCLTWINGKSPILAAYRLVDDDTRPETPQVMPVGW